MAKRCGSKNNPCSHPRAGWWKSAMGINWFDQEGSGEVVPDNALLWDDGTPVLWDDDSLILWE